LRRQGIGQCASMQTTDERIQLILNMARGPALLHVGCVGGGIPGTSEEESHHLHFQLVQVFPGAEVVGIDINADGVNQMLQRGMNVVQMDAEEMCFSTKFDTIVAGELIEHLSKPARFLEGCRRALKPRGRMVLSTPNVFSLMYLLMYLKNFKRAFYSGHALWFCPQTLTQTAQRAGFSVIKLVFVDGLCPELVPSRWYRSFALCWKLLRLFLPKRFRNTIIAVLEPA